MSSGRFLLIIRVNSQVIQSGEQLLERDLQKGGTLFDNG